MPEATDLLFLATLRKGRGSHTQLKKVFEVVGFGIAAAGLPLAHRTSGDAQELGQARLR
jgi:hypothetical protein